VSFQTLVQDFFETHLTVERRLSRHTVLAYRDALKILTLFGAIDPVTGRRDRALLLLLYNTGARVQELVDLDVSDLRRDPVPLVTLRGKGRKQRTLASRAGLAPRHARRVTPHVIRHTTAMHLLQAGVDITTIAAWLGHAQLATTHAYVEINLRMKQDALAAADTLPELPGATYPDDELLTWLCSLGRSRRYVQLPLRNAPPAFGRGSLLHITRGCT
jgi:site-specific recombinase XerD